MNKKQVNIDPCVWKQEFVKNIGKKVSMSNKSEKRATLNIKKNMHYFQVCFNAHFRRNLIKRILRIFFPKLKISQIRIAFNV